MNLEHDLEELFQRLAAVDQRSDGHTVRFLVAVVKTLALRMDGDKRHQRAHIHIDFGKERRVASYAIDKGARLAGDLERRYDRAVREWIRPRKKDLLRLWDTVQAGKDRAPILAEIHHTVYE